jgi:N-acetylmuramoyl-L-alanine amidase
VVLDAGHGGDDAGASLTTQTGSPEAEKYYTLELSVRLRSLLRARGITVVTTRESDGALDADRRAEIANQAEAQACLSIHAATTGTGVHLFLSSLAPAQAGKFSSWRTAQAAWVPKSLALAGVLNSALKHAGIPVTVGRTALTAIDSMACPAVAVEVTPEAGPDRNTGNNPSPVVDDPAYQLKVADALAAALVEWRSDGAEFKNSAQPGRRQP